MREGALDAARIERELDDTRSRLDATLSSLQDKLAPASLADQAVTYFKEVGGVELGRSFSRSMRDNPIPVALIGVGLGWLVFSGARRSESSSANGWRDHSRVGEGRFGSGRDRGMYGRDSARLPHSYGDAAHSHQPMPYEAAAYDDSGHQGATRRPAGRACGWRGRRGIRSACSGRSGCRAWYGTGCRARRRRAFASASSGRWSRRPEVFVRSSPMRVSVPSIWPTAPRQPLVTPTIMAAPPPPTCNAGPG